MADLAACYFCGAALDDSLQRVRLADGSSLTLCRSCREKLDRVFDAVGEESTGDGPGTTTADRDGDAPTESDQPAREPVDAEPSDADPSAAADAGADSTSGATTDEDRAVVAGDQDVSALEYNKVMRMLQNRDFPVDRDEFVTVAANAYQVSYADCDRVIEAAIEQGLLEETDGRLVRPD